MFCQKCGYRSENPGEAFCIKCGTPRRNNPAPVPPAKTPKRPRYVLAVIFGFLMFLFLVPSLAIFNVREAFNPNAIHRMVSRIDIPNIQVGQMLDQILDLGQDDIPLYEWIYTEIAAADIRIDDFTIRSVERLFYALPIDAFLSDILARYVDGLLTGDEDVRIFAWEIENFVRQNEAIISAELGIELTAQDFNAIYDAMQEIELEQISHLGTIMEDANIDLSPIQIGFSPVFPIGFALLALAMLVCMFFVGRLTLRGECMGSGIVLACTGTVFGIVRIISNILISNNVPPDIDIALINALVSGLQNSISLTAIISFVVGAVLISVYFITGRRK